MTVKFSSTSNPRTYLAVADQNARTLPNSEWAIGAVVVMDGNLANTANQGLVTTGSQNASGSFRLVINTGISQPEINTFLNNSTSGTSTLKFTPVAGKAYLIVVQRGADNFMRTKMCPILTSDPVDGSAVVTSTIANPTLTTALVGSGIGVNSVPSLVIGERAGDHRLDQSMSRVFFLQSSLTDLQIAKLAYGLEIADIGKVPVWYYRLNDGADVADRGPNAYPTVTSTTLTTGTAPGFGYVSVNTVPTVGTPVINGTPQVGTSVSYTPGAITGYPYPTITQQWYINGVAISGATGATYIPVAADVGKALTVRQYAHNSEGDASALSAGSNVIAASNAIYVTPPDNEKVYQRSGTSAVVPFSGTYTGTQPTTIEMQTYLSDGVTVARAWFNTNANIVAGGTWSVNMTMPQTPEKVRVQVRGKDASGNIIGSPSAVHQNRFGVGDLIAFIGSSSAEYWDAPINEATNPITNTVSRYKDTWGVYTTRNYADTEASLIAAKAGVVIGIMPYGVGGTSMNDWNVTDRLGVWSNFVTAVSQVGGKLAGVHVSLGSNDAAGGPGNVVSRDSHAAKMRLTISRIRSLTGQSALPILWSGYNRRDRLENGMTQAQLDTQSNYVRMAENDVGTDANVYHVQTLEFELSTDNVHLSFGPNGGFMASVIRNAYIWNAAVYDGVYKRGPRITAMNASGTTVTATLELRGGDTDISSSPSATGFKITDASGTANVVSAVRIDPTHIRVTADRTLVDPVKMTFMAGGAPPVSGNIFGNGATPLPMQLETDMVATYSANQPVTDSTPPMMNGSATVSNITQFGATVSFSAASDNVAISGYEYSLNSSPNWVQTSSTATSFVLSGLAPSTSYSGLVRAIDTSGNRSGTVPFSFTTSVAPDTAPPILSSATAIQTGQNTASGLVTTNEAGGTLYRFVSTNPTESASMVKGGQSSVVSIAGVQNVSFTGLTAGTTYYAHYLHRDAAGNDSEVANTASFTTSSASAPPALDFVPSAARTIKVKAGSLGFTGGAFWNLSDPFKPVGRMDPDSIIDIPFDLSEVLQDMKAPLGSVEFILAGGLGTDKVVSSNIATVFVTRNGTGQISITCRFSTATVPVRRLDATVFLRVEEL